MSRSPDTTRAIRGILGRAAEAYAEDGVVPLDIEAELAGQGYDLAALDHDVRAILQESYI